LWAADLAPDTKSENGPAINRPPAVDRVSPRRCAAGTVDLDARPIAATLGGFRERLGVGHFDAAGNPTGSLIGRESTERACVSVVDGYRIITLDSLVQGKVEGCITDVQLDDLASLLEEPAEKGSVLVLHHPPVNLDIPLQQRVGLPNADRLASVVAGGDIHVILCGHFQLQLSGFLSGIPLVVGSGIVSRIDLTTAVNVERAVRGASATVVDLGP
jgi:3',5'-cyclic-AMP phosphodiesterase